MSNSVSIYGNDGTGQLTAQKVDSGGRSYAVIHGVDPADGTTIRALDVDSLGRAHVVEEVESLALGHAMARFDAAADMPADITSEANVLADLVTFDTIPATARRFQFIWHAGARTYSGTAGAGPIATGARITLGTIDAATAATRLTYVDLTGAGTNSTRKADVIMVSETNPKDEVETSAAITAIYAIGIPVGVTPTSIVPSFLEVRIIG